jgi:hypothetical protein
MADTTTRTFATSSVRSLLAARCSLPPRSCRTSSLALAPTQTTPSGASKAPQGSALVAEAKKDLESCLRRLPGLKIDLDKASTVERVTQPEAEAQQRGDGPITHR